MIKNYDAHLEEYAIKDKRSMKGRQKKVKFPAEDERTNFQHDRDRIIHSRAFRRLEAKTQVAFIHESDHNRTRLTHSLEVAQMSETIAISLGLNTFATQAIALGHDIGHTPFGHTGERALSHILKNYNLPPFKHNYQGLLVVNKLEKRIDSDFGLNLMWETREGILKHSELKKEINLNDYDPELDDKLDFPITLEGQIVRLVDEIAQRTHDTDDALRSNRISINDLLEQKIVEEAISKYKISKDDLTSMRHDIAKSTLIITLLKYYVTQTINDSDNNITRNNINDYDDVLKHKEKLIDWNDKFKSIDKEFEQFLKREFYEHHEIKRMDSRGEYFLKRLFKAFIKHPKQLPQDTFHEFIDAINENISKYSTKDNFSDASIKNTNGNLSCENGCCFIPDNKKPTEEQIKHSKCPFQKYNNCACDGIRVIINHIAGMTDRYTHLEYSRLYLPPDISRL